jgi:GNAT superfamily N-acetyltransferase
MTIRINICCTSRGYSEHSQQARLQQEQRSAPTMALGSRSGLPPGVHSDDGTLEAVVAGSIVGEKQVEVAAVFERTEHYRPTEPHWYLSLIGVEALHRNKGCGAALLQHRLRQCDREHLPAYLWSSNPLNTSLYERHGFEIASTIQVGSSPSIFPMLRHAR